MLSLGGKQFYDVYLGYILLDSPLVFVCCISNEYGMVFVLWIYHEVIRNACPYLYMSFFSTPVRMPCAHLLLNFIGVGFCVWSISIAVWRIGSASLEFVQPPYVLYFFVEIITASMNLLRTSTGCFFLGGSSDCIGSWCLLLN